ncbi:hypothetical protein KMW28_27115 [Flammeovirga yaeyamensis]|uniref:Uncharacterized protein n=1 Tax=Flammeovirga yaeyamensis TaxID=367791 RepID=A0AAX1NDM4_9BACT|nr:hypothetical protein [Flammeovirga yaeyamensis]MBB3700049.1 hypothetical protein [Flammeovirga yaeyamensis]NMF37514.1 hypothetical protein [Flammeovirga yaeyamensis]QWG04571.1 hypothetical protein KMW28_27115 [Flammeovirga yaeyamensis]
MQYDQCTNNGELLDHLSNWNGPISQVFTVQALSSYANMFAEADDDTIRKHFPMFHVEAIRKTAEDIRTKMNQFYGEK